MRLKHNKKRNTAFLFEALTREYVKSVIKKNNARQTLVKNIIKEHFSKGKVLNDELSVYREVLESTGLDNESATRLIAEAKSRYGSLNSQEIFKCQNKLIKEINYKLSAEVFNNFVPNYKSLATVYNIFNNKTSIKEKILLEQKVIETLTLQEDKETKDHIDNLTYKTFVKSFNNKYADLTESQKDLLTNYIASFSDNSLGLKVYLSEQVEELKSKLALFGDSDLLDNDELQKKYSDTIVKLESYKNKEIDDIMVEEVLRIQELVKELESA